MINQLRGMDDPNQIMKNNILYCKHDDLSHLRGDLTFHLCTAINNLHRNQAVGAQKLRAVWAMGVRSPDWIVPASNWWHYPWRCQSSPVRHQPLPGRRRG